MLRARRDRTGRVDRLQYRARAVPQRGRRSQGAADQHAAEPAARRRPVPRGGHGLNPHRVIRPSSNLSSSISGADDAPVREAHMTIRFSRRRFLSTSAGLLGTIAMPYLSRAADRPQITHGVQSGDVGADGGVVGARAVRPPQLMVEVAPAESFANARALPPIPALP